ncbi:MAG TPA: peptide chain release factor N(5)-glutamine methyltransferase [Acidimicrobiales bacterium]|nr:peptide chain release factor N(5)-glutamine methyltransferase [Acidimicrobiales bacterium]
MTNTSWRQLLDRARTRLGDSGEAWRMLEEASSFGRAELAVDLDAPAPSGAAAYVGSMLDRRAAGEPLQYVLGRWGFRHLDLLVDRRVLIPRPETEVVAGVAIAELRRLVPASARRRVPPLAVDIGTGSGAIALAVADEVPRALVWATDVSADALAVARANLAGTGSLVAPRVRLLHGRWFEPLPAHLWGRVDVVVSNPPYVAAGERLPAEVADWEPAGALVSGPTGLEGIGAVVGGAAGWLGRPGSLVVELAPDQAADATALAWEAGFDDVTVTDDLTGQARVLMGRFIG